MRRRADPHNEPKPRRRSDYDPGPVPTLEDIGRDAPWVWVNCARTGCYHRAPMKLAPLIERWGPGTSSDKLRHSARCAKCGHRGATLTTPSWINSLVGIAPFPGGAAHNPEMSNSGGWGSGSASY